MVWISWRLRVTPLDTEILSVPSSSISVPIFFKKIQFLLPLSVRRSQWNLQSQSSSQTTSSSGPQWEARYPESIWGQGGQGRGPGPTGSQAAVGPTFQAQTWALSCFLSTIRISAKKSHSSPSLYLSLQGCTHLSKPRVHTITWFTKFPAILEEEARAAFCPEHRTC